MRDLKADNDLERVRETVRRHKLKAHDEARDRELELAREYFTNDPYSLHGAPWTTFEATCGCFAEKRYGEMTWVKSCEEREGLE